MIDVQWAFISIFTSSLVHFILRIVLGRELGPEGLGIYTLSYTIYLFGIQFAAFGIGSALTKYIAEFIEDQLTVRKYVSSGMIGSIIIGTLMGVVIFLLAPYIAINFFKIPELEGLLRLTALCYPFISIQKAVLGTLNGFRKMHLFALLNIVQNLTVVISSLILVLIFRMGILGAVIGYVAPTILVGILCPFFIREYFEFDFSLLDIPAFRATTIFGFYVVLANSIGYLNTQINSILIGYYLNPEEVGIFAVAILFAQILTLIPSAVQTVTTPVMATLFGKGDLTTLENVFYSTLKKSFYISVGIALIIAIFGQYLITILFGKEFLSAYVPLLILLIGYCVGASFGAVGTVLSCIGKVHIIFRISAVFLLLNIALNILLIPPFGIIGAAIATSITLILNFFITTFIVKRIFSVYSDT